MLREAITALALLGAEAESAVPQLEELAEHEDRQIAARAAVALRQIRRSPEPFQGPLQGFLIQPQRRGWGAVQRALPTGMEGAKMLAQGTVRG